MNKLYVCIISDEDRKVLLPIAEQFAYNIELLDDGVLFDVGGTGNLFGTPAQTAQKIYAELQGKHLAGNVSIARNAASAILRARNQKGLTIELKNSTENLPLSSLKINPDILGIFYALGLKNVSDLKRIPENELISRYGLEFREALDLANDSGNYILTPNLKENRISWKPELDFTVANFEHLKFILSAGLKTILDQTAYFGFSTEQIDVILGLDNKTSKLYEIKLSFPSLDRTFWLRLINLRIPENPPESEIVSITLTSHFIRPRSVQFGLFSSIKPEPESLQLTIDKIKKLVGQENVGIPVLLNQRLPKAFDLDPETIPVGKDFLYPNKSEPTLTLKYFNPPLRADVVINRKKLLHIYTPKFKGKVKDYGGVWKGSSQWWKRLFWQTFEWDVELENQNVYRLQKDGNEWFVIGVYD